MGKKAKVKKTRLPKIYYFSRTKLDRKPYIITDDTGLVHTPKQYFKYKNKVWPIYKDEAKHQECIYFLNEFIGAGEFNFDYLGFFIQYIDRCYITKPKKLVMKTKKSK